MTVLIIDMLTKSLSGNKLSLVIYYHEYENLYDLTIGFISYVEEIYKVHWKDRVAGYTYKRPLPDVLSYLKDAEANGLVFPFDLECLDGEIKKYKFKQELDKFVSKGDHYA